MSYIIEEYEAGEVHYKGLAVGWYSKENEEFRPLMIDSVMKLYLGGYIDADVVYYTAQAREKYTEKLFNNFKAPIPTLEYMSELDSPFEDWGDIGDILHMEEM